MTKRKRKSIVEVRHIHVPRRPGYALVFGESIIALTGTSRFSVYGCIGTWDSSALRQLQARINKEVDKQVAAELRRRTIASKISKVSKKASNFVMPSSEISGREI